MENLVTKLHNKALVSAENYKKSQIELIDVLMQLDSKRAYYQFDCNSLFEYCTKLLKLSESCSYKFIRIARTSKKVPELRESLEKGEISTSKAVSLCSVLTPLKTSILENSDGNNQVARNQALENQEGNNHTVRNQTSENQSVEQRPAANRSLNDWLEIAKKSTNRELEAEIIISRPKDFSLVESKRTLSKEISSLHLKLPKQIMDKFDRAQDLSSKHGRGEVSYTEVLDQLLDFYLERIDPLKKVYKETHIGKPSLKDISKKTKAERPRKKILVQNTSFQKIEKHIPATDISTRAKPRETIPKKTTPTKPIVSNAKLRQAIPQKIRNQIFQKYKTCCYRKANGTRCNQTRYLEIHHKIPVAKGGCDSPNNLVLLCSSCHRLHHEKEGHFAPSRLAKKRNMGSGAVNQSSLLSPTAI